MAPFLLIHYLGTTLLNSSRKEELMDFETIVRRVRAEFVEMPGLLLTPAQATRLWGVEQDVCEAVIDALISRSFLRRTTTGAVARVES